MKDLQLLSAEFQALSKLGYGQCYGASSNRKRPEGHLHGFGRVGLLVHFRTSRQTLFRQVGVMKLTCIDRQEKRMEHVHALRANAYDLHKRYRTDQDQQLHRLGEHMTEMSAGFAQEELLNFIVERRYELNPSNFGNAMAGLPSVAWRQSFKRCKAWKYPHTNSIEYRELKLICTILRSDVRAESLVERMRLYLQRKFDRLEKGPKQAAKQLKDRWYYLQQAIQTVEKEQNPPERVPFRITAEYQRLFQTKTPADEILADEARLW